MGFADAVSHALKNYATFAGRARRSEYWWFTLFTFATAVVASALDAVLGTTLIYPLLAVALFLPGLAVSVRRLHDTGRSGWWILIAFVPLVGAVLLIVWYCQDSQPHTNPYGASPKHPPVGEPGGYPSTV